MTAKECALDIAETCFDQYDDNVDKQIGKMSDKEAIKFCINHISDMISINGGFQWLWFTELQAIKELGLFTEFETTPEEVKERLEYYD